MSEHELYLTLNNWLTDVSSGKFEKFDEYRSKFAQLEREVFGPVERRSKNPNAMKYDTVRNELVWAKQMPKRIETARQIFQQIQRPPENSPA